MTAGILNSWQLTAWQQSNASTAMAGGRLDICHIFQVNTAAAYGASTAECSLIGLHTSLTAVNLFHPGLAVKPMCINRAAAEGLLLRTCATMLLIPQPISMTKALWVCSPGSDTEAHEHGHMCRLSVLSLQQDMQLSVLSTLRRPGGQADVHQQGGSGGAAEARAAAGGACGDVHTPAVHRIPQLGCRCQLLHTGCVRYSPGLMPVVSCNQ